VYKLPIETKLLHALKAGKELLATLSKEKRINLDVMSTKDVQKLVDELFSV